MKKSLLLLTLLVFAVATSYAQLLPGTPARSAESAKQAPAMTQATPASQPAAPKTATGVAAKPAAMATKSAATSKSTTANTSATRKRTTSKKATPVATVKPVVKPAPAPSPFTMLSFVVNRGRVFAADAPGELTSIRLSGYYRTEADSARTYMPEAAINEFSSVNSLTLTGRVYINSDNSGKMTASAILCPLSAPQGLTLTLTVDGEPLSVVLPFVSSDRKWRSGYKYLYTVTVTGGALVVEGVTPLKLVTDVDK